MKPLLPTLAFIISVLVLACGDEQPPGPAAPAPAPATKVGPATVQATVEAEVGAAVQQTREAMDPASTGIVTEPTPAPTAPTATAVPTAQNTYPTTTPEPGPALRTTVPLPAPEPASVVPADMVKVPAPVESVEIIVAESFPPQYFALVVAGLPNGCVEFHGYEESPSGNVVTITVTNLEPAPSEPVACAAVFTPHEFSVPLGTNFRSGETYTVKANGVLEEFVAQ